MIVESFCFLAVLFGMVGFVVGDELQDSQPVEKPGNIELTTEHVVIFKDGYCLVVKDGVAKTDENGFAHTYEVPDAAVLGSFWAVPESGEIKSMVAGWEETKTEDVKNVNCTSVLSIVKANVGRQCRFMMDDDQFDGKILKLLSNSVDESPKDLLSAELRHRSSFIVAKTQASHFLLRTEACLLYTSPSPRDQRGSRMPSSA